MPPPDAPPSQGAVRVKPVMVIFGIIVHDCSPVRKSSSFGEQNPAAFWKAPVEHPEGWLGQQVYEAAIDTPASHFSSGTNDPREPADWTHPCSALWNSPKSREQAPPSPRERRAQPESGAASTPTDEVSG